MTGVPTALMWIAQYEGPAARFIESLLKSQAAEIERLRAGIPSGVTREEWEIIAELRKVLPP